MVSTLYLVRRPIIFFFKNVLLTTLTALFFFLKVEHVHLANGTVRVRIPCILRCYSSEGMLRMVLLLTGRITILTLTLTIYHNRPYG